MPLRVRPVLAFLALASAGLAAQSPNTPAIEVASVKPSGNGPPALLIEPGGRVVATQTPVRVFLSLAFGEPGAALPADQIVGAPGWVNTDRFDVTIKAEDPAELPVTIANRSAALPAFLRALLADRFKLSAHMEKRDRPIFALVARNARLGPDIRPTTTDCKSTPCGVKPSRECPRVSCLEEVGVTLEQFAADLRRLGIIDRPVVNHTGIDGRFDLMLRWTDPRGGADRASGAPDGSSSNDVSIFTSIQDRLGLKLEAATAPTDTLVIEHIERPTED